MGDLMNTPDVKPQDHLRYFPRQKFGMIHFCYSFQIFQSLLKKRRP